MLPAPAWMQIIGFSEVIPYNKNCEYLVVANKRFVDSKGTCKLYSTSKTWSLGLGQSSMAMPTEEVSVFSVQVSASMFLFPDT